jgi:hypothetical protein
MLGGRLLGLGLHHGKDALSLGEQILKVGHPTERAGEELSGNAVMWHNRQHNDSLTEQGGLLVLQTLAFQRREAPQREP